MDKIFLQIINMSITSSYVILFVMIIRLFLKKFPKIFSYMLWFAVLFRLISPFSFEGIISLIPSSTVVPQDIAYMPKPEINSGIAAIDNSVNNILPTATPMASVNPMQIWLAIGEAVWLLGIFLLIVYGVFTIVKLYKKLRSAVLITDNIYETDKFKTPFVFGIIRPKIYLPVNLSETERTYITLHEQTHIKRFDHVIKLISFLITCIHWFNPLAWIAFFLMGEDMELSCDESVIKKLGNDIKKEYSSSLLSLSTGRKITGFCPIAFGENNTKGRIKNVLKYKTPKFWVIAVAIVIIVLLAAGLLSNPPDDGNMHKIDETKVVQIRRQTLSNEATVKLDKNIWTDLIDEINNAKWSDLSEENWPDSDDMVSNIIITLARDESVDNKEYILGIYRNKDKNFLGLEHEFSLALAYNDLTDNIKIWGLPQELYYKIRDILNLSNEEMTVEDSAWQFIDKETETSYDKISAYLKEECTNVFSPYYELLDFIISDYHEEVVNGKVEAIFDYTLIDKNYDRDPDTVEYIKEAKESGDKYYQIYYDEYLKPKESNFYFKAVIDENGGITLYTKNPAIVSDEWKETKISNYIIK